MPPLLPGSDTDDRTDADRRPAPLPRLTGLEPARGRPNPWAMVALFLWALLLRLIYIRQISANPLFDSPTMDPLYHDQWARRIAAGDWLGHEPFFRAPLYPYFLGAVYRLFGPGYMAPRVVQAVLGSLTSIVAYLVGRRVFGEKAALLAGAAVGAYGLLIYFDGELLINVLENLLFLVFLWLLLRAADSRHAGAWGLAGAALGLSALARPTILVVGVAIVPWIAWNVGRARLGRSLLAYGLATAAFVVPVTVRNGVVGGDWVFIASQGGINFYLGNNPHADGWSATAPELPKDWWGGYYRSIAIAEEEAGGRLKPSEVSNYWYRRGFQFLRDDPRAYFRLLGRKVAIFWSSYEFGNNEIFYFFRRYAPLVRLPLPSFGLVAPLALAGMILLTRDRRRVLLSLFVVVYMLTIVAFFVCDKLRLPVVPVLIAWASAFVVWWVECLRRRRPGRALASLLVVVPLAVGVNHDFLHIPHPTFAPSHAAVGGVYLAKGQLEEAEREFRACMAISYAYPDVHLNLGAVLTRQGRLEEAAAEYREEMKISGESPMLLANLASLLQSGGKYEEAIPLYQRAIELGSKEVPVRYNLGLCLARLGRFAEAEPQFRQVLAAEPQHLDALNNLGVVMAQTGRYNEAIAIWEKVLALDPDFVKAKENIRSALRDRAR